ncbi:MAG: hypothetical protein HY260_05600, partial [Chloroflexi bacterium]|nr:hypothetical protein [Chloroflexota bacterium]
MFSGDVGHNRPSVTNNASDTKRKGIAAAKAGQASLGRLLLRRAVVEDSGAGDAWYWLSEVVEDPAQRLDCLRRALAINPADPLAHAALERLTAPREKEVPPAPDMAPLSPPVQRLPVPASVSTIIHVPASLSSAVASSTEEADAEAAPAPPGAPHVSGLTTPLKKDLLNREDATPQLPAGQADTKKTQENFALSSGASARYSPRFLRVLMAFTAGALIVAGPAYYLNATGQLAVPRPLPSATIVAPTAIRPTPRPTQALPAATRHSPVQNTPLGQATQAPRP